MAHNPSISRLVQGGDYNNYFHVGWWEGDNSPGPEGPANPFFELSEDFIIIISCDPMLTVRTAPDPPISPHNVWTDVRRQCQVQAEFKSCSSGRVRLVRPDGTHIIIPLKNLSLNHQHRLQTLTGRRLEELSQQEPKAHGE